MPVIYALNHAQADTKREMIYLIKNKNEDKKSVAKVIEFVHQSGGMKYAETIMNKYKDEALAILDKIKPSIAVDGLKQLVQYTIERRR